ncbi:unnamed protein product [Mytilus edulis]|uniref:Uncharacterized protein n=1 Tax=Mytilus edulis TaxID=6550 RepID=A0A8S3U4T8_MYTED|nr:unnamed protein product [Mytilus edulis]
MVIVSPVIATLATTLPTKSQTVSKKNVSTSTSLPLRETGRSRASNKTTMTNVRTLSVSATHKQLTVPSTQMSTSPSPINSLSITTLNKPILKTTTKKNKRTTKPVIVMKTIATTLKARSRMTFTIPTLTATQTQTPIAKTTTNRRTNIASRKRTVKIKRPRLHTTTVKTMPRTYKSESNYGSSFAIAITSVGALILFLMCGFAIWNIIKVFSRASELAKIKPFKEKTNDRSLISDW